MSESADPPKKERERLGWLTESAGQPRKRRLIEGIAVPGCYDCFKAQRRLLQCFVSADISDQAACAIGVGAAGVLDLKAELYKQQLEAQHAKEDPAAAAARRTRRAAGIDLSLHAKRNAGVERRDQRDREQIKVESERGL